MNGKEKRMSKNSHRHVGRRDAPILCKITSHRYLNRLYPIVKLVTLVAINLEQAKTKVERIGQSAKKRKLSASKKSIDGHGCAKKRKKTSKKTIQGQGTEKNKGKKKTGERWHPRKH
jgi:hypothetical protein